jgi:predicted DNA-binding WGR domain protein
MTLKERNDSWKGERRFFQQQNSHTSEPRTWSVRVENGNQLKTTWGQKEGVQQEACQAAPSVNDGKSNYISPEENAIKLGLRMIDLKTREGYREATELGFYLDSPPKTDIELDEDLPEELSFWKPVNATEGKMLDRLNAGQLWLARKRNGMAMILYKNEHGALQMYSRRMLHYHDDETGIHPWEVRFKSIADKARVIMPRRSIILGELIVEVGGVERFDLAQSYIKSLTEQSVRDQAANGEPFFYCWDVAFWDGIDLVRTAPVRRRYELIHDVADYPIVPVEVFQEGAFPNAVTAIEYAKAKGWEGFVVVDPEGIFGDKGYNFKGKPDRPNCATKLKPSYEDDFIAIWDPEKGQGERSTKGSRHGGIKSVALHQFDRDGRLVFVCNVSSGMTKTMFEVLADPLVWPQVWQVEYTSRRYIREGDDTNALDFPRFKAVREDKGIDECTNPRL